MTEKPPATPEKLGLDLAKIFDLLEDLKDRQEILKDNLDEAKKDLTEDIRKVQSFQQRILEPNQQTIYKEVKKLQGKPEPEEPEEE